MNELIEPLTDSKPSKDALLSSGVLNFWVRFASKVSSHRVDRDPDDRMAGLNLLTGIWCLHPTIIEMDDTVADEVMMMLKRAA